MRIVVTGAGGFIGSHVAAEAVARGHDVLAWVRRPGAIGSFSALGTGATAMAVELRDQDAVAAGIGDAAPEAIVHAAWYSEPGRYLGDEIGNLSSLAATANLLAGLVRSRCRRVVLVGSCLEDVRGSSASIYAAAKRAAHQVAVSLDRAAASAVCGHVHHVYGPREDQRRVLPAVIDGLLHGSHVPTTEGLQLRDYLHVSDVARALVILAESDLTGRVAIRSGDLVALRTVLETVQKQVGGAGSLGIGELPQPIEPVRLSQEQPTALMSAGWRPRFDLDSGIADTIQWWRNELEAPIGQSS